MKRFIFILLVVLALVAGNAVPVYAASDPDGTPALIDTWVFRNLYETDDRLFVWEANIPYATTPDELVSEAYIWQLLDTDNTTELGRTTGYAFYENGFGYNVYSIYFSADDAVTWGQAYNLKLVQNPAVFGSPQDWSYPISTSSYTSLTDQEDNRTELATRVLLLAAELDARWGLSGSSSLLLESESGTVLSIYGEAVFRGAIYGIQALAPYAFRIVIGTIDAEDRTWDTEYAENLTTQYSGTWIQESKDAGGDLWGVGYDLTSIILVMIICVLLFWLNIKLCNETWMAFVDVAAMLVMFPRLDMIPLTFTALLCSIFIIIEGIQVKEMI